MSLKASFIKKTFKFKFDAGTSRGILKEKDSYFIFIYDTNSKKRFGIGEAAPLKGLSIENFNELEKTLEHIIYNFNLLDTEVYEWNISIIINQLVSLEYPSIRFGLETALLDYLNGCKRKVFENDFSNLKKSLPINGLIWMGDEAFMLKQIDEKLAEGYSTLKMKIGSLSFENELKVLTYIRQKSNFRDITLRVDANGAFEPSEIRSVLKELKKLNIHSIEQPIKAGQVEEMKTLCEENIIPIALDEELIGKSNYVEKKQLLKRILPQYIILKPTLLGGFQACNEWIEAAKQLDIKWWATSALESTVGLNAICQYVAEFENDIPQGLGTGKIYEENIISPLEITKGNIYLKENFDWQIESFFNSLMP